ncbi:MAG: Ldh family oxidoreductase [Alphaproteobacteria bacterium]|nr:Ldh family oxidoreductase [Alphaproteobacteria bacterium]
MTSAAKTVRVSAETLSRQVEAILAAWGMLAEPARVTTERLIEADLRGIDSHGIAMLPLYDEFRRDGRLVFRPEIRVVREAAVTALWDAGGGLGHYPSTLATDMAIKKAKASGVAVVAVRNSNHYGAAGVYVERMALAGLIGLSGTNVHRPAIVPTFGAEPMFGTNPIAFAAPTRRNRPFVLDMATSTAAIGKFKMALMHGKPVPEGWAVDEDGGPLTDPARALALRLLTPLGGSRELGSHKGYGLAAMIEILSAILPGAIATPLRNRPHGPSRPTPNADNRFDVGHFFAAIDPAAFREPGEFEADMDDAMDALRATRPADPAQPVLVAGDPEYAAIAERREKGIPVPVPLVDSLRTLAEGAGAPFVLA